MLFEKKQEVIRLRWQKAQMERELERMKAAAAEKNKMWSEIVIRIEFSTVSLQCIKVYYFHTPTGKSKSIMGSRWSKCQNVNKHGAFHRLFFDFSILHFLKKNTQICSIYAWFYDIGFIEKNSRKMFMELFTKNV